MVTAYSDKIIFRFNYVTKVLFEMNSRLMSGYAMKSLFKYRIDELSQIHSTGKIKDIKDMSNKSNFIERLWIVSLWVNKLPF